MIVELQRGTERPIFQSKSLSISDAWTSSRHLCPPAAQDCRYCTHNAASSCLKAYLSAGTRCHRIRKHPTPVLLIYQASGSFRVSRQ